MSRKTKNKGNGPTPASSESLAALELSIAELTGIIERALTAPLDTEGYTKLKAVIETLGFLKAEWQAKKTSIHRLLNLLFGARTEKSRTVLGEMAATPASASSAERTPEAESATETALSTAKPKAPGHGRNGAAAYTGAQRIAVAHTQLHAGDECPSCTGKLYPLEEPARLVRITGMAPLTARVYECERLRCNLCGEVYTAPAPAEVGDEKYDERATAMVALLKYGVGLPFNRIEKLQAGMGIPLPAATQWDLVKARAAQISAVHEALIDCCAQGEVVYNDDTTMTILKLTREQRAAALSPDADGERSGVFTSGILATAEGRKVALFFTGVRHAGENLNEVLKRRAAELPAPIQMCDGLISRNVPKDAQTLLAQCLVHARRGYVEVAESFPTEVRFVLELLSEVYATDARTREENLTPEQRLKRHQDESGPRMQALEQWMRLQIEEHLVEPNSTLGQAIGYMRKRWSQLTLFLREVGAPLDNNACEQILKKAILHRKNALFYRTIQGAAVGDLLMSLIHTAELNQVNAFDYLVALLNFADRIDADPQEWLPWNYRATLTRLTGAAPPT
jgi:transposase